MAYWVAVVELADTRDLKSLSGDRVRVQAPPVAWKSPGKCRNAFTGAFCVLKREGNDTADRYMTHPRGYFITLR